MARAYSADMRERVIARVESGASRREAAEHYEVSASTAVIWVKCFRETGRCSARPRGGSTSPLEQHAEFLLALIEDEPDLTLDEVLSAMRKHKVPGSRTAVWRFFQRPKITFKKSAARGGAKTRGRGARTAALVAKGPLQIIISIADQQISVYDDGTLIARSSVSTGVQGHPTPIGVFSVIGKELWHRSNICSAAPMPYMQRITWSGIALHAGVLPGHPASHGCIRLANDFAIRLLASNEARHTGTHCAPRCPTGPDSEPAPFCKTEDRVQFAGVFGRRARRERRPRTRDKS